MAMGHTFRHLIHDVHVLHSRAQSLALRFFNAGYADGARDFEKELKTILRSANFPFAQQLQDQDRDMAICDLTREWIGACCPSLAHKL